jgi:hypothetical protein
VLEAVAVYEKAWLKAVPLTVATAECTPATEPNVKVLDEKPFASVEFELLERLPELVLQSTSADETGLPSTSLTTATNGFARVVSTPPL